MTLPGSVRYTIEPDNSAEIGMAGGALLPHLLQIGSGKEFTTDELADHVESLSSLTVISAYVTGLGLKELIEARRIKEVAE